MDKSEIELKLTLIGQIENLCSELIQIENPKQNDDSLSKILKDEYKLSKAEKDTILSTVKGKKKGESTSKKGVESLKSKLSGFCGAAEIKIDDRNGTPLTYQKIKTKVQNLKNKLKNTLKDLDS